MQSNLFSLQNNGDVGLENENGTNLVVTQNIYDSGLREVGISGAKAALTQSVAQLTRTKQQVTFTVISDYFALLRAQKAVDIDLAAEKSYEEQLASIQGRVKAGDAAQVDVLPIQASLANARVTTLTDQNTIATSTIALQEDMGLTPETDFAVKDFPELSPIALKSMNEYLKAAYADRPDITAMKAGVDVAKHNVTAAKIVLYPYPVISGNYAQPLSGNSHNVMYMTGGLVFNLFDGGSSRAAYHAAQADLLTARVNAAQLSKSIQSDVQDAYLNLTSSQARLAAGDVSVQAAQENLDAQKASNRVGLATPLDIINAEQQLVTAQSNLIQARYEYYTALAQLEFAVGKQGEFYGS